MLRIKKSFKAQKVFIGEKVKIYDETGDYFKIQVDDGLLGYIEKKYVMNKKRVAGEKKIISEKKIIKQKKR